MSSSNAPQVDPPDQEERSGVYLGQNPSQDPQVRATARTVRNFSYPILLSVSAWVSIPILIGVIGGVFAGEVRDPVTKRAISSQTRGNDCHTWAIELVKAKQTTGKTPAEIDVWKEHCRGEEPDLLLLLEPPQAP